MLLFIRFLKLSIVVESNTFGDVTINNWISVKKYFYNNSTSKLN